MARKTAAKTPGTNATKTQATDAQAFMEENGYPPPGYAWNPHAREEADRWVKFGSAEELAEIQNQNAGNTPPPAGT
jgi:hypothetical protein